MEWLSRGNHAPYGAATKPLLVQPATDSSSGFNGIYLLPVNLYGPEDNFDPQLPRHPSLDLQGTLSAQLKGESK